MLIVCTTGCYDKDEIKDAEKYLFKDIQYSFEEGDGFSTYDVEPVSYTHLDVYKRQEIPL